MKLEILNKIEELKHYKTEMGEILNGNNNDNPFLTYDWIVRWWRYFGEDHELFILVMKNEDILAGLCPFMITKKAFVPEVNFISYPNASYMDIIVLSEYREEFIRQLGIFIKKMKGSFLFNLHGLSESSPNLELLRECLKQSRKRFFLKCIKTYFIQINGQSFDSYFKSRSTHRSVKNIVNNENKIRELGTLIWQRQNLDELDAIFDIHKKRWLKKNDCSGFSKGETRDFFKNLVQDKEISSFKPLVYTLKIDSRMIGFAYGFECNGKYLFYRIAHDDDFAVYGPGKIITKKIIKYCCDNGYKVFDFLRGYERFKMEWSNSEKCVNSIVFPTNGFMANLAYCLCCAIDRMKCTLKKLKSAVYFKKVAYGRLKYYFSIKYLRRIKKRIINKKNNDGILAVFGGILRKICKTVYDSEKYYILKNSASCGICGVTEKMFNIRPVSLNELDILGDFMNSDAENITRRFYKGHKCFFLENENTFIGYVWLCFSKISIRGVEYSFSTVEGCACIYEMFVCKAYQKTDARSVLLKLLFERLREDSYMNIHMLLSLRNKLLLSEARGTGFELKDSFKVSKPFYRKKYSIKKLNMEQKIKDKHIQEKNMSKAR